MIIVGENKHIFKQSLLVGIHGLALICTQKVAEVVMQRMKPPHLCTPGQSLCELVILVIFFVRPTVCSLLLDQDLQLPCEL